jgi:hypothetical protein
VLCSWGEAFGSKGYYRWKMGDNLCGIEHEAWTGCPLNSKTCKLTKGVQVVTPDPQNVEEPVPYHNGINDIAYVHVAPRPFWPTDIIDDPAASISIVPVGINIRRADASPRAFATVSAASG